MKKVLSQTITSLFLRTILTCQNIVFREMHPSAERFYHAHHMFREQLRHPSLRRETSPTTNIYGYRQDYGYLTAGHTH